MSDDPVPPRMSYDFQISIDTGDPHVLADWWADMLGWEVEPSDEDFIRSMIAQGYAKDEDTAIHRDVLVWREGAAILHPEALPTAARPRILFQLVPEPKTVKNRVHLDVNVGRDRVEAEIVRLTDAGASVLHRGRQGPHTWVALADPEGNEFCIR